MYLMFGTRRELAFAVGHLSCLVSGYTEEHWAAVKRVLRYVKGSVDKSLFDDNCASGIRQGFSDEAWECDYETRRSTTPVICILDKAAVS